MDERVSTENNSSHRYEWNVSQGESGSKLLVFLRGKFGAEVPARQLKRVVDAGKCYLNGKVERFGSKLVGLGDRISFELSKEIKILQTRDDDRYLYVDDDLIAYNKPAGIASDEKRFLEYINEKFEGAILLHRLDRDTTGVLLFARNSKIAEAMKELFKQRQVEKHYYAVVDGVPGAESGLIDNSLGKLSVYQGQTIWGEVDKEKGVRARTLWQLDKTGKNVALLSCYPETGRTHQIRVHLSGIGHPILGDSQYGRTYRSSYHPSRLLLHAAEIAFNHPRSQQHLAVKAPLPEDFMKALKDLKL